MTTHRSTYGVGTRLKQPPSDELKAFFDRAYLSTFDETAFQAVARINGRAVEGTLGADGYLRLESAWAAGDAVQLDLAMEPRLVEAHPWIESTRGTVAMSVVMRRPRRVKSPAGRGTEFAEDGPPQRERTKRLAEAGR